MKVVVLQDKDLLEWMNRVTELLERYDKRLNALEFIAEGIP